MPGLNNQPKIHSFTKCPSCGGTRTLANTILQEQIKAGKMPKDSKAFIYQHQSLIAKATGWLSAPIILTFFDVCSDCGTAYCVHAEERMAVVGNKMPPAGQGFSNS